jgi:hypothetical protein
MKTPTLFVSFFALLLAAPSFAGPLSRQPPPSLAPAEKPLNLDISGSYGPSPVAIIFRDAAFGALAGGVMGGAIGAASDSNHWGRDAAIGAAAGLLLGAIVGGFEASSEPHISVHADVDRQHEGTPALSSTAMQFGRRF